MGVGEPFAGALHDVGAGDHRRLVVPQPWPIRRSAVYVQGDGGTHRVARRIRRRSRARSDGSHRKKADGDRRLRGNQLVFASRPLGGDFHSPRFDEQSPAAGTLVSGPQKNRGYQAAAARRHARSVLQRRVRRHLRQHLCDYRRRLRRCAAEGLRRAYRAAAAARARGGEDRTAGSAGREDLDRAVEHQTGHAWYPAAGGAAGAGGTERSDRFGFFRNRDRPRTAARDRRLRLGGGHPCVSDPDRRPYRAAWRYRANQAWLRRSCGAADPLHGQGRGRYRGVDETRRQYSAAR